MAFLEIWRLPLKEIHQDSYKDIFHHLDGFNLIKQKKKRNVDL